MTTCSNNRWTLAFEMRQSSAAYTVLIRTVVSSLLRVDGSEPCIYTVYTHWVPVATLTGWRGILSQIW